MNKVSYQAQEYACEQNFSSLGRVFHFYSAENFKAFLLSVEDFIVAMNVFALVCAYCRMQVKVLTFQLMNNHFHVIACGQRDEIEGMVGIFIKQLQRSLSSEDRLEDLADLGVKSSAVDSLDYARKSMAYVNRNGFLVNRDWTPMTYPWGANRFFFNEELKSFHNALGKDVKECEKRRLLRSKRFDDADGLKSVNGVISPLSYCDISAGELLFRDSRHYFDSVSRAVDGMSEVAAQLGETAFLTDSEIFSVANRIIRKEFNAADINSLDTKSRLSLAKRLRYDYCASSKQISRMLRLTEEAVALLFGNKH